MNNEEMSEIIQKLNNVINKSNVNSSDDINHNDNTSYSNETNFDQIQNTLSGFNFNLDNDENNQQNNNFNFDFETIMKVKNIIDTFNSAKNSPETNLLLSLKPYLNSNRKQKIDQYIQFLNITKVIENLNNNGGVNNNGNE